MGFATLAVVSLVALLGPLLALPRRWHLPVVVGELAAGVLLGPSAAGLLHAGDPAFAFLADLGFALIMFVAGSHVPVRNAGLRSGLRARGLAKRLGAWRRLVWPHARHEPHAVISRLARRVLEALIGLIDLLKAQCCVRASVAVGMPRQGKAAKRDLDRRRLCIGRKFEDVIIVALRHG